MPISVTTLGTASRSGSAGTTIALSSTVPSGALIVVVAIETNAANGSVTDAAGNSYTRVGSGTAGVNLYYSTSGLALSAQNITYTLSGSGFGCISALYATGITSPTLDTAVTTTIASSGTSSSTVSGAPSQAGELFIAFLADKTVNGSGGGATNGGSWVTPPDGASSTSGLGQINTEIFIGGDQVNAGTGTLTFNPSGWATSINFFGLIVAFQSGGGVVGNNQFFTPKHKPSQHTLNPQRLRHDAQDNSTAQVQPETNTYFIAKHRPYSYTKFNYNAKASDDSTAQVQPETNTYFIAKYLPPKYTILPALTQNPALDNPGDVIVSTPVHFIAKHQRQTFTYLMTYRTNFAADQSTAQVQPETNVHFIGKFRPWAYTTFNYNTKASDTSNIPIQPSTPINFIGKFNPFAPRNMLAYRQIPAYDIPAIIPTDGDLNYNFKGKFTDWKVRMMRHLNYHDVSFDSPVFRGINTGPLFTTPGVAPATTYPANYWLGKNAGNTSIDFGPRAFSSGFSGGFS